MIKLKRIFYRNYYIQEIMSMVENPFLDYNMANILLIYQDIYGDIQKYKDLDEHDRILSCWNHLYKWISNEINQDTDKNGELHYNSYFNKFKL